MRIYIYYIISMAVMAIYGGQVCPFIDSLTLWNWSRVLAVFFILIFIVRTVLIKVIIQKKPLVHQTRAQFLIEFLVFIGAGIAIAIYNYFTFAFPPFSSGVKVIVGMLTLGSFLSIDMALERERIVIGIAQRERSRLSRSGKLYSLTKKFALAAILVLLFISIVILLVIEKDIHWIATVDPNDVRSAQKTVSVEIIFVVSVTIGLVLNLIYSYSKNLKLFFENETRVLNEVNQGALEGYVPMISHDEFALIADHTNSMIEGLREKRKIQNIFGKVVSQQIATRLMAQGEDELMLGGKKRNLTILISDIRSFTSLTESENPEHLVSGLNRYFTDMVSIIRKQEGFVDKFIGDGILAIFGLDEPNNAATHAVRAALEMQRIVQASSQKYELPIQIGIGIHCGNVIAGNIGSAERLEFTFIGDPVNTAARLESLTKTLNAKILVSDSVYTQLVDTEKKRPWIKFGEQSIRGKSIRVNVFGLDEKGV